MHELFGSDVDDLLHEIDDLDNAIVTHDEADDGVISPDAVVADIEHIDDDGDAGAKVSAPSAGSNAAAGSGATVSGVAGDAEGRAKQRYVKSGLYSKAAKQKG